MSTAFERRRSFRITGFSSDVTNADILNFINQAVDTHPLAIDLHHDSTYWAVIQFSDWNSVTECVQKLKGKTLNGNVIAFADCKKRPISASELSRSTTVKMDNLSRNVTEQMIADHLRKHSKIRNPPKTILLRHHLTDLNR